MFNSPTGRTLYRFIEVFVIAGAVAVVQNPDFAALVGPSVVALVLAGLKGFREYTG